MTIEAEIVFGGVVVLLSAGINAALEYPSLWRRIAGFLLMIILLVSMAAGGAMMGIIIREAIKAIP